MSIVDYGTLQAAITAEMARTDLAANNADFIARFEAVANRRLRVRQQEISVTLTPSSGSVSLPADYLAWRRVTWSSNPSQELEYVTPVYASWQFQVLNTPAHPTVFSIEGSTLYVRPIDNTALNFEYFQKIPPLATATSNWLVTEHPDIYLYGSLYHAYSFIRDFEGAAFHKAQRDELFDEIVTLSNKTRGVGGMRVLGPTP